MFKYLEKIGLNKKEALLYDVLIKRGELTPSQISFETKLTREYIYSVASDLEKKVLLNKYLDGRKSPIAQNLQKKYEIILI